MRKLTILYIALLVVGFCSVTVYSVILKDANSSGNDEWKTATLTEEELGNVSEFFVKADKLKNFRVLFDPPEKVENIVKVKMQKKKMKGELTHEAEIRFLMMLPQGLISAFEKSDENVESLNIVIHIGDKLRIYSAQKRSVEQYVNSKQSGSSFYDVDASKRLIASLKHKDVPIPENETADKAQKNQQINLPADKTITELDLSGKRITDLPSEIAEFSNLKILNLFGNRLTKLPPFIFQLSQLEKINLTGNHVLAELPPEIGKLKNLKKLYLATNRLRKLPAEIGNLTNLTSLGLAENQIIELPPEIGKLQNLKKIYLQRNQLTKLPPEIADLKNLETLSLHNNPIENPPFAVCAKGIDAIREYFNASKDDSKKPAEKTSFTDELMNAVWLYDDGKVSYEYVFTREGMKVAIMSHKSSLSISYQNDIAKVVDAERTFVAHYSKNNQYKTFHWRPLGDKIIKLTKEESVRFHVSVEEALSENPEGKKWITLIKK